MSIAIGVGDLTLGLREEDQRRRHRAHLVHLTGEPLGLESALWFLLFGAAGHSIAHHTAIRY